MSEKIVIYLPSAEEEFIFSFPFLIALKEKRPEARISVIIKKGAEKNLQLLPFRVFIYTVPERLDTFLGAHKFAVNIHDLFNIDTFIDLNGDHKSAFFGLSLRAKQRWGLDEKIFRLFYNKRIKLNKTAPLDKHNLSILGEVIDENVSSYLIGPEEPLENHDKDENILPLFAEKKSDFIFVKLENFDLEADLWIELLSLFEGQKIVLWQDSVGYIDKTSFTGVAARNEFYLQDTSDNRKLNELISEATIVITNDFNIADTTLMKGKYPYVFTPEGRSLRYFYNVKSHDYIIEYETNSFIRIKRSNGENKEIRVTDEIIDLICHTEKL